MRTYLKTEGMEWFIYNENVNEGDGRKNKTNRKNTPFDCPSFLSSKMC